MDAKPFRYSPIDLSNTDPTNATAMLEHSAGEVIAGVLKELLGAGMNSIAERRVEFAEVNVDGQTFYFNLVVRAEDVREGC